MKKFIFIQLGLLILFLPNTTAQQLPIFTQYTEMQTYLNPASIAIDYLQYNRSNTAGLSYRYQWTQIEGAPNTLLGRYEHVKEGNNLVVLGGYVLRDQVGPSSVNGVYGRYAYMIRPSLESNFIFGIGLSAGILQYRIKTSELDFQANDQLAGESQSDYIPDFAAGFNFIYYPEYGTKWYGGISIPQIFGIEATFKGLNDHLLSIQKKLHVYANAGAIFAIGQQGFLEPSIWVKYTSNIPLHIDFNVRQKFLNNFWLGLGYSTSKSMHFETGIILKEVINLKNAVLRIGYGFDYGISSISHHLGTVHEINISYAWNRGK